MCLNVDPQFLVIVSRLTTHLMLWGLQSELYLPPHFFDDSHVSSSIKRHVLYQYLKVKLREEAGFMGALELW